MEKYIYNEQNGLWYELQGDYYSDNPHRFRIPLSDTTYRKWNK